MKVLVIGGGGREHALAWKMASEEQVEKVYVTPGNAGTAAEPGLENVALDPEDAGALVDFARQEQVDLTVVGPETPLVAGVVDRFREAGLACFGPSAAAARLEGSKAFAKDFMARHGIPTAAWSSFTEVEPALAWLREQGAPVVVKADGLAAGKGVVVAETLEAAENAVRDMLAGNRFGEAGHRVVLEEFLDGEEASFIVMVDGEHVVPMATSQDYKRVGEGDTGPNTGGMGACSPAPVITSGVHQRIMDEIIMPTVRGMAADGSPYTGFLYAGLMILPDGSPRVIEYNCRFGDPETQPIMMRLRSGLAALCLQALDRGLEQVHTEWDPRPAVGIVMAADGYPGSYRKGDTIEGLEGAAGPDRHVFHAGTTEQDGRILTSGGRVLCVTAQGESLALARDHALEGVHRIHWPGARWRGDIAWRALRHEGA